MIKKSKSLWTKIAISFIPILSVSACSTDKEEVNNSKGFVQDVLIKTKSFLFKSISPMYSKKQIEQKLDILSTSPVPANLEMGAMCYEMAMAPDTASYICPECGTRTLYNRDFNYNTVEYIEWELGAVKREIDKVEGINIDINEIEFCRNCSPDIENPNLLLYINIEGTSDTIITKNVSYMDIRLIIEFLSGSLIHNGSRDDEEPLVDYKDRIQQLLGL